MSGTSASFWLAAPDFWDLLHFWKEETKKRKLKPSFASFRHLYHSVKFHFCTFYKNILKKLKIIHKKNYTVAA